MEPLAIVGIGCRFPGGVESLEGFWELLRNGVDAITDVPADRWDSRRFSDPDPDKPGKTCMRQGGFVRQRIDEFDAHFFGISPREAAYLDPQQRLLLEITWEALEDAGMAPERLDGSDTAVFIGAFAFDSLLAASQPDNRPLASSHTAIGVSLTIVANRLSHFFGFRGPSVALDTACSSSMVALHYACQSLRNGECTLAVAGGVNVMFRPEYPILMSKGRYLSPDSRCRSFDERANGYVRGEGAGIIVLKRLSAALADGDPIHALILGSGVNQDGHTNGITVPSREAQEALLREVYRRAGVAPADVQYVEAHGTGTAVGDPIEANALGAVLGSGRPAGQPCLISSVKTNIGHLEAAAGVAGVIKTVLCLKHRQIPPHLHLQNPNPKIPFADLRLRIPQSLEPWPEGPRLALAGVNSFGFGGTNAHAVLQEAPRVAAPTEAPEADPERAWLLPLSARSPKALEALAGAYRERFAPGDPEPLPALRDICYSASVRRGHHDHRLTLVAHSREDLHQGLGAFLAGEAWPGLCVGPPPAGKRSKVVFVYTGMGPQWWGMGRELLREEPIFRAAMERIDALFRPQAGWSLLDEFAVDETNSRMTQTLVAQTANFALQAALTDLWRSWGVEPAAVVGHSVGEVAAAYAAGVLSLEDAMRVSFHRARLQATVVGGGKMLAVGLSAEDALHRLNGSGDRVAVAAINGPDAVTLSGDGEALDQLARGLAGDNVFHRFLQVEVAYHSHHMDPLEGELLQALHDLQPRPAAVPLYSSVTGRPLEGGEVGAAYWWHNMRDTVRFAAAVDQLIQDGHDLFLEVGPHPVLAASITACLQQQGRRGATVASLQRLEPERPMLLGALGRLYTLGYPVYWGKLYPQGGRLVRLPAYPWQREYYWAEALACREDRLGSGKHPLLDRDLRSPQQTWQAELNAAMFPFLPDHCVEGAIVFPGAGYIEAGLAAAGELAGDGPCELEGVEFHKALVADNGPAPSLRMMCEPSLGRFSIHSRLATEGSSWMLHATGQFQEKKTAAPGLLPVEDIRGRCPEKVSAEHLYNRLRQRGLEYGPWFRGVRQLWRGREEVFGEIEVSQAQATPEYRCHPAVLDAGFQALLAAVMDGEDAQQEGTLYLPIRVNKVLFHGRPGSHVWVHGRITHHAADSIEGDVSLCDQDGTVRVEVRGLRCQAMPRKKMDARWADWLYEFRWQPRDVDGSGDAAPAGPKDVHRDGTDTQAPSAAATYLVFADEAGCGRDLADRLAGHGDQPVLVFPGPSYEQIDSRSFRICPTRPEDWQQLLQEVRSGAGLDGGIYLWALDATAGEDVPALTSRQAGIDDCVSLLHLVQALIRDRAAGEPDPRLWVVTRGAQQVHAEDRCVAPGQATLWGFGRVINMEYPELRCKAVDLDPAAAPGDAAPLFQEWQAGDAELETALRGGARYVLRMIRVPGQGADPAPGGEDRLATGEDIPLRLEVARRGSLDGLTFRGNQRRDPGPGEVEIRVRATGITFKDVMAMGLVPGPISNGTVSNETLGLECSGTVVRVGERVEGVAVGQDVVARHPGCFSTHLTIPATATFPKLDGLSFEEEAAVPVVFLTAYYALHEMARLRRGERVLIHSATGGVGLAALQVARWLGAEIFATAGSPEKRDLLRQLGVRHVMDSRSLAFADEVMELTGGKGVDVVLNSLPGKALAKSLAVLAPYGRFLEIGGRDIDEDNPLHLRPFSRNLSFISIDIDRLGAERPESTGRLLGEIRRLFQDGTFTPLPVTVFPAAEAADAFRLLAQAKHTGKVVLSLQGAPIPFTPAAEPAPIRPDSTYLIAGGLTGFGLETAKWMVGRGARNLVLLGRSGAASLEAREAVAAMERQGARVLVARADVTSGAALARVLADATATLPPLRGVVCSAGVFDDGMLNQLTRDQMEKVLAPKVLGAWNLHAQTLGAPLDFFILYSSATTFLSNRGQANYVAANSFLDALAHYRRARGLPALCVNWGSLAGSGYVARNDKISRYLELNGLKGIPVGVALAALEALLRRNPVQIGVMDLDWPTWCCANPVDATFTRHAEMRSAPADSAGPEAGPAAAFRAGLLAQEPAAREPAVRAALQEVIGKVLRLPPAKVDSNQAPDRQGVDSLMAVEVQALIQTHLGVEISPMLLMRGQTVTELAEHILSLLLTEDGAAAATTPDAAPPLAAAAARAPAGVRNGSVVAGPRPEPARAEAAPPTPDIDEIPVGNYRFESSPEYLSFCRRGDIYETEGYRNPFCQVYDRTDGAKIFIGSQEYINFANYNYLALCGDPEVNRAVERAVAHYGTSASASRIISGERPLHQELEKTLADLHGTADCVAFIGGYITNVTTIGHLFGPNDLIVHDALIHNSALTGSRLSGATAVAFPHNDWRALDALLAERRRRHRRALVLIEGVYSQDGDVPDLPRFIEVKRRHKAFLMVDEAHSLGVLGATGRGIGEHFGVDPQDVDLWMGTLSKTLASCGGYIAGGRELVRYLRYTAPGLIYSVGMTPPNAASALASIRAMLAQPWRVAQLRERARLFLELAKARGLDTGFSRDSAVIPVLVGSSSRSLLIAQALFERGINVLPIFYPVVEESAARLRFFVTCAHTEEQIRFTVDAVAKEWARVRRQGTAGEARIRQGDRPLAGSRR